MLEIHQLCSGYGRKTVLQEVSLSAHAGEVTAILGPNGCGKSTLLKTLCAILPATSGQVTLDGQDLLTLPANRLAQKVAYLAQNRQVPDITVARLVLHGRFPYLSYPRRYRQEDYLAARKVMEQMRLSDLAEKPLSQLSGGQQQKAYIAMALAQDTGVILLDEPTTYLDVAYQLQTLRLAKELARSGKHVLMVIHDLSHALETADHVVLMASGRVIMEGTPEEVYGSGALGNAFGVGVVRVETGGKAHYICTEK
ncbi:MAG: ABC transporter ATP-binding protein [Faecousia sp.]